MSIINLKIETMIDFVKCEVLNVDISSLMQNKDLDFQGRYHISGEVETRKLYANIKEMLITIVNEKRVFLQGSLPNMVQGNNYENLTYSKFKQVVEELETLFGVGSECFKFQNFEFGFTVDLGIVNPTRFLIEDIVDYKGEIVFQDTYRKNGFGIVYRFKDYHFKLYDKSAQYKLDDNLLRIEIRVKRMQHVRKYGIKTLKELLNENNWYILKNYLVEVINETIMCSIDKVRLNNLTQDDFFNVVRLKNPEVWKTSRPNPDKFSDGSKDSYYRSLHKKYTENKNKFREMVKKNDLDFRQKHIIEQINLEYRKVLPKPTSRELYKMGLV
jgi:hypothetical protein